MTEFRTSNCAVGDGRRSYGIIFETDREDLYKAVQSCCQYIVDVDKCQTSIETMQREVIHNAQTQELIHRIMKGE